MMASGYTGFIRNPAGRVQLISAKFSLQQDAMESIAVSVFCRKSCTTMLSVLDVFLEITFLEFSSVQLLLAIWLAMATV